MSMALAIGIDLGTTNSVAAVARAGKVTFTTDAHGATTHPSIVAYPENQGALACGDAVALRNADPSKIIASAKRLIGQNFRSPELQLSLGSLPYTVEEGVNQQPVIVVGDKSLRIPEVSAEILRYLKAKTEAQQGQEVSDAVITVPANFTDGQRKATQEAGVLAGLNVLRLINEPTAAALAYGFGEKKDATVAIYDFGGGTFDISILRVRDSVFEVLASDGEFFLGGDDIDNAIAIYLAQETNRHHYVDPSHDAVAMARLRLAAEQIKCHLSNAKVAEGTIDDLAMGQAVYSLPFMITREKLQDMAAGYVDRTLEVVRGAIVSAGVQAEDIDEVVCVGGSTRMPYVRERLAELFGKDPKIDVNPDEVVAQGAAIQAASLTSAPTTEGTPLELAATQLGVADRPVLLDVVPASLSVATAGGFTNQIVEKNAPVPIRRSKLFTTSRPNQERVVIECCRGESNRFDENEVLGTVILDHLPPAPRGECQIEVTFAIDADGILNVEARDRGTGMRRDVSLNVLGAPQEPGLELDDDDADDDVASLLELPEVD